MAQICGVLHHEFRSKPIIEAPWLWSFPHDFPASHAARGAHEGGPTTGDLGLVSCFHALDLRRRVRSSRAILFLVVFIKRPMNRGVGSRVASSLRGAAAWLKRPAMPCVFMLGCSPGGRQRLRVWRRSSPHARRRAIGRMALSESHALVVPRPNSGRHHGPRRRVPPGQRSSPLYADAAEARPYGAFQIARPACLPLARNWTNIAPVGTVRRNGPRGGRHVGPLMRRICALTLSGAACVFFPEARA